MQLFNIRFKHTRVIIRPIFFEDGRATFECCLMDFPFLVSLLNHFINKSNVTFSFKKQTKKPLLILIFALTVSKNNICHMLDNRNSDLHNVSLREKIRDNYSWFSKAFLIPIFY